tara:strand:- start:810 stop:1064 length:255 start_codon:yes stop_codon:yes gene_type:complete
MSFIEIVNDIQGQRGTGAKPLKMDVVLDKLERDGKTDLKKQILEALNDISYTNSVIHDALKTQELSVSQSAVRTWRIRNDILKG